MPVIDSYSIIKLKSIMNKKIFNIGRWFSVLAIVGIILTACEKDDNSNPTFKATSPSFTLNVPANAQNNVYDLVSANSLELTCTQPNYNGVPYVVQYHVQVALSEDFSIYKELETSYTKAKMAVDAYELNTAMIDLFHEIEGDIDYPDEPRPLYVRLRANVINIASTVLDTSFSNVITLPNVLATFKAPELSFPTSCYIVGSSIGDGADKGYWSYDAYVSLELIAHSASLCLRGYYGRIAYERHVVSEERASYDDSREQCHVRACGIGYSCGNRREGGNGANARPDAQGYEAGCEE